MTRVPKIDFFLSIGSKRWIRAFSTATALTAISESSFFSLLRSSSPWDSCR